MRQEGTDFLPDRQLQTIRPHLGVGTEAVAPEAIGIGADTAVIGIGPGPPFAGAGTQGLAIEGIAAVLTLAVSPAADTVPPDATGGHAGGFLATAPALPRTPRAQRWRAREYASSLEEAHHSLRRPAVAAAVGPAAPGVWDAAALAGSFPKAALPIYAG